MLHHYAAAAVTFVATLFGWSRVARARADSKEPAEALTAAQEEAIAEEQLQREAVVAATNGYEGVRYNAYKFAKLRGLTTEEAELLANILMLQATSESGGNRLAANRTESEMKASRRMYRARGNKAALAKAVGVFPDQQWYFPGSGGWYGLMGTVLANIVRGKKAKGLGLGPKSIYMPWPSTVMYLNYLARLMKRREWGRSTQDVYALKAGGAAPTLMDNPTAPRYLTSMRNANRGIKKLGLPSDFGTTKVDYDRFFKGVNWMEMLKAGLSEN